MQRMVKNVSWRDHISDAQLYGILPKVSSEVQQSRKRLSDHYRDGPAGRAIRASARRAGHIK